MANGINACEFIGNIGRVETKYTPNGIPRTSLSIAVNERTKVNNEWTDVVTWVNCTLWRHENLVNFLEKGKQVRVMAKYRTREYEKDGQKAYAHEFVIDDILLLGGGSGERSEAAAPRRTQKPIADDLGVSQDDVSDLPF